RESAEGTFLLAYREGQLAERIEKVRGQPKNIAVYAGDATLMRVSDGRIDGKREVTIAPGSTLVISGNTDLALTPSLGETVEELAAKGSNDDLRAALIARRSLFAGVSY